MEAREHVEAIVIGSGQGGTPLARALAGSGKKTMLVEEAQVGGTCVNVGCTPTKTMVASARAADMVRRAAEYGVRIPAGDVEVDLAVVRARKDSMVHSWRAGSERSIEHAAGLELLRGMAHFVGPHAL